MGTMSELAPGNVTIGDLYRELVGMRQDITRALTRIEVIDTRNVDADRLHNDHESRLRALERFRFTMGGLAIVGEIVAGVVGYWLGHVLH